MKIGIIGAMDQEVALLRAQMSNVEELTLAGCEFYSGLLAGQQVVLTRSGIGKVAAAVATTLLLDRFAPDCVINTGSAGGFDPELHIGDVVISTEVRHHDVDVTAFGYEPGQVPRMPAGFAAAPALIAIARAAVTELHDGIQCKEGLICTGDQFMCDPERIAKARSLFPTAVWLNPMPRSRWAGTTAGLIADGPVPMLPLDAAHLLRAIDILRGNK
jgi:adenosylhomocysteine nucleosidase